MRAWAERRDKVAFSIDNQVSPFGSNIDDSTKSLPVDSYQYSFVGPLSMQKGCDRAYHMYTRSLKINNQINGDLPNRGIGYETNKLSYRGK